MRSPQPSSQGSAIRHIYFNHISLTDRVFPIKYFQVGIEFDAQLLFSKVH